MLFRSRIGHWDNAEQAALVRKAVSERPDLIIACPGEADSSTAWIKDCNRAGIPVIISSSQPANEAYQYIAAFNGFDDWGSHRVLARDMAEQMGQTGGYCVVQHKTGSSQGFSRTWAIITELKKIAPDMRCLEVGATELDREKTRELVCRWAEKYGSSLKAIMVGDAFHPLIGTVEALTAAKRDDVLVYVTGNNKISLEYMKQGKVHGIRWESAEADGALALETAIDWFNGLKVAPIRYLPAKIIKPADVRNYFPPQW